eukprot:TRINITY_DN579_c0_g1_i1.p1 TRINITY_DN579_c0_g1~~TRINITY_DN579_c0_g1_i1.p1  ORF type:complete len:472 (-),score=136.62 TRINITY_DN579_c0_g1_i1:220-1635(-)
MAEAKRREIEQLRKRVEEAKRAKAEEERRQKEELRTRNERLRAEIAAKEAAGGAKGTTGHSTGTGTSDADAQIEQLLRELRDLRRENAEMERSMPQVAASVLVEKLRDRGVEPLDTRSRAWDDFSNDFVCEVANEACSTGVPGGMAIGGALAAAGGCSPEEAPMCSERGGEREDIWSQAQGFACEQANMACGWTFAPQAGQSIGSSLANVAGCSYQEAPLCWDRARPRGIWSSAQGYACEAANMACGSTFAPQYGQSIGSSLANAAGCSSAQAPMCVMRKGRDWWNQSISTTMQEAACSTANDACSMQGPAYGAGQYIGGVLANAANCSSQQAPMCVNRVVAPKAACAERKEPCFDRSVTRWLDHEARNHHDLPEPGATPTPTYSRSWRFLRALEAEVEEERRQAVARLEKAATARGIRALRKCYSCGDLKQYLVYCIHCDHSVCTLCYDWRRCAGFVHNKLAHDGSPEGE